MNAILFLKHEHDRFRKTFKEISDKSHKFETKKKMLDDLCLELVRHETMEQSLWYPHFESNEELKDIVKHLISEEKSAEKTMREFEDIKSQKEWDEKLLKFKKDVEHHANEEETKLFPKVETILSKEKLDIIGKEMAEIEGKVKKAA